jgi:TPP-dependent indolepyruvate ferredoxin oxidoreductase alpha subunit
VVTIIGDSAFFHAVMPALVNMAYNKSNGITIILDDHKAQVHA